MKGKSKTTPGSAKSVPERLPPDQEEVIRSQANYNSHDQAAPLNDPFFTGKSNPLSSKGN